MVKLWYHHSVTKTYMFTPDQTLLTTDVNQSVKFHAGLYKSENKTSIQLKFVYL